MQVDAVRQTQWQPTAPTCSQRCALPHRPEEKPAGNKAIKPGSTTNEAVRDPTYGHMNSSTWLSDLEHRGCKDIVLVAGTYIAVYEALGQLCGHLSFALNNWARPDCVDVDADLTGIPTTQQT